MAASSHPSPLDSHTWQQVAEDRIRQAQEAGEFDDLPGFGQPIPGIDEPHDELWWIKAKLRRERLTVSPAAAALWRDAERRLA